VNRTKEGQSKHPIRLGGSVLGRHRHICAFFSSRDEEYRVLLPFIIEGFEAGENGSHIVDPRRRAEHLERLQSVGIDTTRLQESGRFVLRDWADAHLKDWRFDQEKMLALAETMMEASKREGRPRNRHVSHMEWALQDFPGVNDLLEYEARANYLVDRYDDPVICTYDLSKFGGAVVVDMMRTHPLVVIGGVLQENPFFVPPDEFLRELRERQAKILT